ncbi:MAG: hypothetical protein IJC75_00165 [Oscillospiraceae bacterium]|nr:hypothetical protein [Oscillospiraceae bacterium]
MEFLEQLRQEAKIHSEQEIDFKSRRFQYGRDLARTYIEMMQHEARLLVRCGRYTRMGSRIAINGFCRLIPRDFDVPVTQMQRKQSFWNGKWSEQYTLTQGNDLFEAFLTGLAEFGRQEHITCGALHAQVRQKDGTLVLRPVPLTITQPSTLDAIGFPFEILLDIGDPEIASDRIFSAESP